MWLITRISKIVVAAAITCCVCFSSYSQSGKIWGIGTYGQLSQTGFSNTIGAELTVGKFQFFLGPKFIASKAYDASGPWGMVSNVGFFPNGSNNKISSFTFIDIQNAFDQSQCSNGACEEKTNVISEFSVGYGFIWNINEKFALTNVIGIGASSEKTFNHFTEEYQRFWGYNNLLKLGIRYHFTPKNE